MNGLPELITTLGIPLGIIIWVAIGIINLINKQGPAVVKRYQERKADETEHTQSLEEQKLKHLLRRDELLTLTEAGNRTFTEEQLTHHLSEVYGEFQATNEFIRKTVSNSLQRIEQKLDQVLIDKRDFAEVKERLAEVRMYTRASYNYIEAVNEEKVSQPVPGTVSVSNDVSDIQD